MVQVGFKPKPTADVLQRLWVVSGGPAPDWCCCFEVRVGGAIRGGAASRLPHVQRQHGRHSTIT